MQDREVFLSRVSDLINTVNHDIKSINSIKNKSTNIDEAIKNAKTLLEKIRHANLNYLVARNFANCSTTEEKIFTEYFSLRIEAENLFLECQKLKIINKISLYLNESAQFLNELSFEELRNKLQSLNQEFCNQMTTSNTDEKRFLIYYSNRNFKFKTIGPMGTGTEQETSDQKEWEKSEQYIVLQKIKEKYRDAIIKTKNQLKHNNTRESETKLEYFSECCRKFFNYLDKILKIIFRLKYTMDDIGTPFAKIIRNKPNFFNRLEKHDSNLYQNILSLEKLDAFIEGLNFDLNEMPSSEPVQSLNHSPTSHESPRFY